MIIKKITNSEGFLPFSDYNKVENKKENRIKSITLILIALLLEILIFLYYKEFDAETCTNFIKDYIDTELNIIALLLSFSIAYLTIIITSDSQSITKLKEYITKIKIDNKNISLFQQILIQLTYTIYTEIVLLVLLLIHKFIILMFTAQVNSILFITNTILLLNIIYIILKNVKNIYLSFWKNNTNL